jgi:polyhydroxybutyrate depolymerase
MAMRMRIGMAVVALAVVVGACSGGDDGGDAGSASSEGTGSDNASAVPSPGCEAGGTAPADLAEDTTTIVGAERRWLLSAPAWEEGGDPLPLVLDFHGLAEGADIHAEMTQLGPLGVEEGFVTVFPHGTGEPVSWNTDPNVDANPDLQLVVAVLDRVEQERCIDTSRIFATGLSNGAMMTSAVACGLSDRIAAVAPVAGIHLPEGCDPTYPMPILTFHGTADPILLFNGGVGAVFGPPEGATPTTLPPADLEGPGYPETVRGWAELNGCEATFTDEQVSETVIRRVYHCPDEAPLEFVIVQGGGHSWPGSEFSESIGDIVGPTTFDIDASREAWAFFQRHQLPAA